MAGYDIYSKGGAQICFWSFYNFFFYLDIKLIALFFSQIVKNLVFAKLTHFKTLHGIFYEDRSNSLCTNSFKIIQRYSEI